MRSFNNVSYSQEFQFPEQSTIRRYYVETGSATRKPNVDPFQDNPDSLKFYVVARRNYSAVDVPFVVPNIFSRFTANLSLFGTPEEVTHDFFDRGVTTTDDADPLDDSPFPLKSSSPSVHGSASPTRSKRRSAPRISDDRPVEDFFDQPFDDSNGYGMEEPVQFSQSQSPQRSPVRRSVRPSPSRRYSLRSSLGATTRSTSLSLSAPSRSPSKSKPSSPLKASKNYSVTSIPDSGQLSPTRRVLELEDLKSSRGSTKPRSEMSKRSLRTSDTSNSLYKLDRKRPGRPRKGLVSKPSDVRESHKVIRKGPYNIHKGPRKIVGLPKPLSLPPPEKKPVERKKARIADKKEELALYKETGMEDVEYDMGGFETVEEAELTPKETRGTQRVIRRSRPSVSSSALLNSWYITHRQDSDVSDWPYEKEAVSRSVRYPKRSRLPPTQHWISNMIADGSSVVFLAGVSSKPVKSRYMGSQLLPDTSLVLTKNEGKVKVQLVDKNARQDPKQANITEFLQKLTPGRVGTTPKRTVQTKKTVRPKKLMGLKKPAKEVQKEVRKLPAKPKVLRLEDVKKPKETKTKEMKRVVDNKVKKKRRLRRMLDKIPKDLTADEALEIINMSAAQQEGGTSMEVPIEVDLSEPEEMEMFERRLKLRKEMHEEVLRENPNYDSYVENQAEGIYYRCVYSQDENTYFDKEVAFNPMVITSQCRTSDIVIPRNEFLDFGNVKSNFICGYVYTGSEIVIEGQGEPRTIAEGSLFYLPSFNNWLIRNESSTVDAHITLAFVNT